MVNDDANDIDRVCERLGISATDFNRLIAKIMCDDLKRNGPIRKEFCKLFCRRVDSGDLS
jgi:hypothetical protein